MMDVLRSGWLVAALAGLPVPARPDAPPARPSFVYGGDAHFAPFDYLDDQGRPTGFDVELVRALARDAGVEVEIRLGTWEQARANLDAGTADLISLSYSEERAEAYRWLVQTWSMRQSVLFPTGRVSYPRGPDRLAGETIAVQERSAAEELLAGLARSRPAMVAVGTQAETLGLLERRVVTGVGGNSLTLRLAAARAGIHDLVEMRLRVVPYGLVARNGREARFEWVARSMAHLREAGAVETLAERFLAVPARERGWRAYATLGSALVGVVLMVSAGVFVWNRSLRRKVRSRTRELESTLCQKEDLARSLTASEERYRLLFEGNPLPMLVADLETLRFLAANEAAVRQYGHSREELLGLSIPDLAVPGDENLKEFLATRYDPRPDLQHVGIRQQRRKDGTIIDVDLTSLVITFGGRRACLALARDVTAAQEAEAERDRLQTAVERATTEWQRTFDAVDTCVLILDRNGLLKRINRATRALLGQDYSEVLERRIEDLGPGEPWRTAAKVVRTVRATGTSASAQTEEGAAKRTWDLTAYLALATPGGEERTILVVRDISRLVALQESLRRSETMSAMGSLVAGVAHEVRNPLFSISATVDALASELEGREEHAEFAELLRSQVARLTRLMQDLLDYGKPPVLRPAAVHPAEIIRRAIRSCAALARERGVRLGEDLAPEVPPLEMDASRMEQVFENLIANAIQHSPPGARVQVVARCDAAADALVELRVEDEGTGLAAPDIKRLFEPFFSRRQGGTGLGLSVVQRIVEAHGGSVTAGNRPTGGAAFTVALPLVHPAGSSARPPRRESPQVSWGEETPCR